MTKGEKAKALFESGYTCAQAVFLAFEEETGLDNITAVKMLAGFGGGFGRLREICGAACGMTAVISYLNSSSTPNDYDNKSELYKKVQSAMFEYKAVNGSYISRNHKKQSRPGVFTGLLKKHTESCPSGRRCSTRNAVYRNVPRVRIPNSPPIKKHCQRRCFFQ